MIMKRVFLVQFVFLLAAASGMGQSIVPAEWKFLQGDKPEYIEYLDKHNELGIYMQGLAKSLCDAKLQPQKSQNN